ncbi:hypothetical protein AKJ16_DCAP09544 [Drosera capensis]
MGPVKTHKIEQQPISSSSNDKTITFQRSRDTSPCRRPSAIATVLVIASPIATAVASSTKIITSKKSAESRHLQMYVEVGIGGFGNCVIDVHVEFFRSQQALNWCRKDW